MTRHLTTEGKILDTAKAGAQWNGAPRDWGQETLYRSSKGNYWIEETSLLPDQGGARFVTPEEAAGWLLSNGYEVPEDLRETAKKISE